MTASRAARPGPGGDAMSRSGAVTDRRAAVAADRRVAGGRRRGQDPARGRGPAGTQWPADRRGGQGARNGAVTGRTVAAHRKTAGTKSRTAGGRWAARGRVRRRTSSGAVTDRRRTRVGARAAGTRRKTVGRNTPRLPSGLRNGGHDRRPATGHTTARRTRSGTRGSGRGAAVRPMRDGADARRTVQGRRVTSTRTRHRAGPARGSAGSTATARRPTGSAADRPSGGRAGPGPELRRGAGARGHGALSHDGLGTTRGRATAETTPPGRRDRQRAVPRVWGGELPARVMRRRPVCMSRCWGCAGAPEGGGETWKGPPVTVAGPFASTGHASPCRAEGSLFASVCGQ